MDLQDKENLQTILDCMTDGGVSYIKFRALLDALEGNEHPISRKLKDSLHTVANAIRITNEN